MPLVVPGYLHSGAKLWKADLGRHLRRNKTGYIHAVYDLPMCIFTSLLPLVYYCSKVNIAAGKPSLLYRVTLLSSLPAYLT